MEIEALKRNKRILQRRKQIQAALKDAGVTQKSIAAKLGCTGAAVSYQLRCPFIAGHFRTAINEAVGKQIIDEKGNFQSE